MKLKTLSAAAITLLLSAFTVAPSPETDILGSWKVADASVNKMVKYTIDKIVETNPDAASQVEDHKDQIVDVIKGMRVVYKADKTYESQSSTGNKLGKWEFANNYKIMKVTKTDGSTREDVILELTAKSFKVINGQMKDTVAFDRP
ncbi:hypothetical protein D0C36_22545 [Mucilaginibacter conchicola]|uniref:Lipocalin-like domain-containing protein n=1 Tax=Mucilaginibacter conchicola TaxID=2303333 RepID=A0A372NPJ7_9SPHI|nr:hypothetical protein [Mucilaginibacter conchicola]RFZ90560.1 hypothetical protein D0C36_22545 [Mucilaginibacter conchicola]